MVSTDAWKSWYAPLKNNHPDAYRQAIEYGAGVAIKHGLSNEVAGDVERALVMLACSLLKCRPD